MSNSTIKLKSSTTAGNTPTSLETGEFAINVADGNLFYGSASAVKQDLVLETLTVKGSLTAENYVISSSVTHMTQSFSSGSTVFGDSIDDTHLFTGSLSITGSSHVIKGTSTRINQGLKAAIDISSTSGNNVVKLGDALVGDNETYIEINDNTQVITFSGQSIRLGNQVTPSITASGIISSSNTIIANAFSGSFSGDGSGLTGLPAAAISSYTNAGSNRLITSVDSSTVNGEQYLTYTNEGGLVISNGSAGSDISLTIDGDIVGSDGHIKLALDAGGNDAYYISSSGDILATTFKLHLGDASNQGNGTNLIIDDENEQITTSKALSVTGNITVTGTVDGRDLATDGTKLDGIEANADVTDATNVTAAGALMDSEVTSLSLIKGLTAAQISGAAAITTYNNASNNRVITSVNSTTVNSEANLTFDGSSLNVAGNYNIDSYNLASNSSGPDAIIISNDDNRQDIYFGKDTLADKRVKIFGQLTASAEISSSEKITAKRVGVDDYIVHNGNVGNRIAFGTDTITIQSGLFSTTGTRFSFPITASSNISSSGAIITNELTASGLNYPSADGTDGQSLLTDGAGNLTFEDPNQVFHTIKNKTGATLTKGTPVFASGSSGNALDVYTADASDSTTMPAAFIVREDIADDAEGKGIIAGFINGIDTSTFNGGDTIYVAVGGGFTNIKPTGSALLQNIGKAAKIDASNGSIIIMGAGRTNDVPNLGAGKIFYGQNNTSEQILLTDVLPSGIISSSAQISSDISGSFNTVSSSLAERITNSTNSEALYIIDSTGGTDNVTDTPTNLTLDSVQFSSSLSTFTISASHAVIVNADMRACISFHVGFDDPTGADRTKGEAFLERSTDSGTTFNLVSGSNTFAYVRNGNNNDTDTATTSNIILPVSSGDRFRVRLRTQASSGLTTSTVAGASGFSIFDLLGGAQGPEGPSGSAAVNSTTVQDAGALMDSEVTNLAQVKAFDSSDYATAAQGAKADTAIQPSQTSSFSTATGVENNADVTDTANVTAAGALMDSELTEITTVKSLTAAGISGSFNAASASFSTRVTANDEKLTANTSNVQAAGALMDSEVTNLAQVKAFDSSDYATAAQGTKADTAIQPSQTSSFSTATGVEDNADVTDTANVTAAGALMDSEVTNLAQVKAFDSSDYATAAQGTKADTALQPADTASLATIVELNTSSSALQSNIDSNKSAANRITYLYTSSVGSPESVAENYIHYADSTVDFILINTSSYNNVDLDGSSLSTAYSSFFYTDIGSLLTVRNVDNGAFRTFRVTDVITNYQNNGDTVRFQIDNLLLDVSSGSLSDGDEVEFIWDKSAGVGGAYGTTVGSGLTKTLAGIYQGGYNYLDMFFGIATDTEFDGVPENLSGVETSASFGNSRYFLPAISQSESLTLGGLTVNGNITVTGNVDGTDVAQLKSDFDTLEGKTLVSSSDQILPITTSSITDFPTEVSRSAAASGFGSGGGGGAVSAVANGADDRIATFSSTDALNGESALTFDGTKLLINPASATANAVLFDISVNGDQRAFIDEDGDASFDGYVTAYGLRMSNGGAQSSPSLAFGSDTNTGIYAPAADNISIQAGGSTAEINVNTSGVTITNGTFGVNQTIYHIGDTDTKIDFTTDNIQIDAGGATGLEINTTGSTLDNTNQIIYDTASKGLESKGGIGEIVKFGGTTTIAGGLYYLKPDGTWGSAQGNAGGTATSSLAIAVGTDSTTDGMILRGFINPYGIADIPDVGNPLYINADFGGRLTGIAPDTANHIVRIVGHYYGTDLVYFNPSNDWIVVS